MKKQVINPPPPGARVPASQATRFGDVIWVAGQVGRNPATNEIPKGMAAQTRQCLENMKAVLAAAGSSMDNVLKVNIYVTDMSGFAEMNAVYREYFSANPPARATVEVKGLANPDLVIEIEAVAHA